MDWSMMTDMNPILEAGTVIVVQYYPPDRMVARVTRTIDLKAHAQQFAVSYRASMGEGLPDLHQGRVGDAWAMELFMSGVLDGVCDSQELCAAHEDWMVEEHDYEYTLNIYPQNASLGGKGAWY